jgi:hypothetical protein
MNVDDEVEVHVMEVRLGLDFLRGDGKILY